MMWIKATAEHAHIIRGIGKGAEAVAVIGWGWGREGHAPQFCSRPPQFHGHTPCFVIKFQRLELMINLLIKR